MSKAAEAKRNGDAAVHGAVNQLMRGLGLETQGRLMDKTPVDRGRARANWNVSTGAPDTSTDDNATKASVPAKQAEGASRILRTDFAGGEELFVTNGLPYIKGLEDGHSQQAPAGMVAVTVQELKPVAEQIARKVAK
jgi:hypothetical protein